MRTLKWLSNPRSARAGCITALLFGNLPPRRSGMHTGRPDESQARRSTEKLHGLVRTDAHGGSQEQGTADPHGDLQACQWYVQDNRQLVQQVRRPAAAVVFDHLARRDAVAHGE